MNKEKVKPLKKYVVFFYIYAFFGWIIDVSIVFVSDGQLTNRGFLYETICPMYGIAALVLIVLSKKFNGKGRFVKRVAIATIWCSVLEYITSLILDVFFKQKWWDYSNQPYNLQGRICLAASLFWGLLSILFMNDIHPFIEKKVRKFFSKIPIKIQNVILWIFMSATTIDFIISVIKYLQ